MAIHSSCDILVVGGGTGGCAAALAASSLGLNVWLTEETDWLGGQLTSQIVPPDEHPWIESFGCTARYRDYRNRVREYYRQNLPLTWAARKNPRLNPGGGWVSRLCHDPSIGQHVLRAMVQPALTAGNLHLRTESVPIAADLIGDAVRAVTFLDRQSGEEFTVEAQFVIDATELGDLLPLTKTAYRLGSESKAQTGEEHAADTPNPEDVQGITWCYALGYDEGSHRAITKPANYEFWRDYKPSNWHGKVFDFIIEHPETGHKRELPLFGKSPDQHYILFTYRQIVDPSQFEPGTVLHPATVVNWPMNDYYKGTILDVPEEIRQARLAESKEMGLALLYWLQTDAPRHDGGTGYPGLYLRPDLTGTNDGFAKYPYIRESRRIESHFTIKEEMVSPSFNKACDRAPAMPRSIGVGSYRMDIHPRAGGGRTIDQGALPFQIPLGSLIPMGRSNLLAGAKNLGVTHLTNGCYRLHPVEWNIGESAGLTAGFCLAKGVEPAALLTDDQLFQDLQGLLARQGVEMEWPVLRGL